MWNKLQEYIVQHKKYSQMIKIVKLYILYHNKNLEKKRPLTISKGDALMPVYSQ